MSTKHALLFLCFLFTGVAVVAQQQNLTQLSPKAIQQLQAIEKDQAQETATEKKLSTQLLYTLRSAKGRRPVEGAPSLSSAVNAMPETLLLITIKGNITPELLAFLGSQGGTAVKALPKYKIMSIRLPAKKVEAVAERPEVQSIELSAKVMINQQPSGLQNSEGDISHAAAVARAQFHTTGTGTKVCVISDSVDHLSAAQANGSLGTVQVLPGAAGTGQGEGTAMLEIVHRIAPGANLAFADHGSTDVGMALNILQLKATGCSIIVDDITYPNESPFQDGVIANAVGEASSAGILYFSSAANSGNQLHGTSGTWEGDFNPGNQSFSVTTNGTTTTYVAHQFSPGVIYDTISETQGNPVTLFWNDALGSRSNRYQIAILDPNDNITGMSNTGGTDPYESINGPSSGSRIVILKETGSANRFLHLSANRARLALGTSGATQGHNASGATNAFTVAAIDSRARTNAFVGGTGVHAEDFSSDGPRRMFYTSDGSLFTPGNLTHTGGQLLKKPDLTAADCVTTDVPNFAPFCGTSAAAPQAAAIAALIKSAYPSLTPAQMRIALTSSALDIETTGWDNVSGQGIVMPGPSLTTAKLTSEEPFVDFASSSVGLQNATFSAGPGMGYNVSYGGWLLRGAGSNFSINFNASAANTPLKIIVAHCTSALWPAAGYAPVDIKLNGTVIAAGYDVSAHYQGFRDYVSDQFVLPANAVRAGANTLTFQEAPGARTNYWIRAVRVAAATP